MFKGPLMEQLGIESEAEWAAQVEAALQGFEHVRPVLAGADPQVQPPQQLHAVPCMTVRVGVLCASCCIFCT